MLLNIHYDSSGVIIASSTVLEVSNTNELSIIGYKQTTTSIEGEVLDSYLKYSNFGIYYNLTTNSIELRKINLLDISKVTATVGETITINSAEPVVISVNKQEVECKKSLKLAFSVPGKYLISDPRHINLDHGFLPVVLEITDE